MKFPKSTYQYSILSGRLRLIAFGLCIIAFFFSGRLAHSNVDQSLYDRIHVDGEHCYVEECPFAIDSEDYQLFVKVGLITKFIESEKEISYVGKTLIFSINPEFLKRFDCSSGHNKGNVNYDPYLPFPQESLDGYHEKSNERCCDKCEVLFSMVEKWVFSKKDIPNGLKIVGAGIVKTASQSCKKCCSGANSFLEDCLKLIIDSYQEVMADMERGIKKGLYETEQGIHDLYGMPYN